MDKVEGDVSKIQKTIGEVGVRTRAINRTLREVSDPNVPQSTLLEFSDFATRFRLLQNAHNLLFRVSALLHPVLLTGASLAPIIGELSHRLD